MKSIGMSFNTEMVQALLSGNKTVTRRPLKIQDGWSFDKIGKITSSHPKKGSWGAFVKKGVGTKFPQADLIKTPCWVGDEIYVRESSWCVMTRTEGGDCQTKERIFIADGYPKPWPFANDKFHYWKTIPSIHMPKWASRITLKVTDVRIEKVQDITVTQAMREGIAHRSMNCPIAEFGQLYNNIYGNWSDNPYVWVIEFEVIKLTTQTDK